MDKNQNKARRIRELIAEGRDTRQIADEVGCRTAYVRATRQRNGGTSPADMRYIKKNYGGTTPQEAWRNRWRVYAWRRRQVREDVRPP